ncbi:hypothetical protein [Metabacillus bambusae]|uniref:Uncharacterized protein n=1 Tax=Metabacillus bambusae TaxID=2795218 RepID=A0ABS3N016_9BACI|nr:hypothetical protein [Metabacillus bambusae]MBO1511606.1 hypothetical protein [Metabacillus bambusae]
MFNKKRKRNSFMFTASLLGAGAVTYYLTKDTTQGEDRDSTIKSYSSINPINDRLNDL